MSDISFSGGRSRLSGFAKYAWFALVYNLVVILWGVFLRASKSGDGCGQHWLTCGGEVIPSAPEMKTVIEYSHRLTSGIAFLVVLALLVWAFRKFPKGTQVRRAAAFSFIFIITEALVGAGLVLTGNTAETLTDARPFWAIGHLVNTFILLAFLSLTAWLASSGREIKFSLPGKVGWLLAITVIGLLFVGMTGSLAALANMLFPSQSIAEGVAKDFAESSHAILRLRVFHPISSIMASIYIIFLAGWFKRYAGEGSGVAFWSNVLSVLVLIQLAFGALTLLTLGPIVMQLGHLFLADAVWISFILLVANYLSKGSSHEHVG